MPSGENHIIEKMGNPNCTKEEKKLKGKRKCMKLIFKSMQIVGWGRVINTYISSTFTYYIKIKYQDI